MQAAAWIRGMFEEGIRLRQEHGADGVYDFSLGNPVVEPPPAFHEALHRLVSQPTPGMHRYMPNTGYVETRAAVAEQLASETGIAFAAEHVTMVVGAAGGLNVVFKTLLDPGDEVMIFSPYFVEYNFYADNHQGVSRIVPTDAGFNLDLAAIEAALSARTKIVLINSPNNPSGVMYDAATIQALGDLLRRRQAAFGTQIYLVSDEPYKKLLYDGLEYPEVHACFENSIAVTSHAKDLALPGERLGHVAVNPACAGASGGSGGPWLCQPHPGVRERPGAHAARGAGAAGRDDRHAAIRAKARPPVRRAGRHGLRVRAPAGCVLPVSAVAHRGRHGVRQPAAAAAHSGRARARLRNARSFSPGLLCGRPDH